MRLMRFLSASTAVAFSLVSNAAQAFSVPRIRAASHRGEGTRALRLRSMSASGAEQVEEKPTAIGGVMEKVLFVEVGFGNDQHGQDPTKACVRACRDAIEFNSIPSINTIVPGGYANMKLRVQLAVPVPEEDVDVEAVKKVFPYGQLLPIEFQSGGMRASSGIELPEMGDRGDDMIIAISCVSVGY